MQQLEMELKKKGKTPYIIPTGGSTKIGALGYLNCISEVKNQSNDINIVFDHLIHATGSGGTQSGLIIGKELYYPKLKIIGINVGDKKEDLEREIRNIMMDFKKEWKLDLDITNSGIKVIDGYFGKGYGIPSE